jgi:hypothetical protein
MLVTIVEKSAKVLLKFGGGVNYKRNIVTGLFWRSNEKAKCAKSINKNEFAKHKSWNVFFADNL